MLAVMSCEQMYKLKETLTMFALRESPADQVACSVHVMAWAEGQDGQDLPARCDL